jgi:glycosyltransferase involved in cell wall biosynthesis
MTPKLSILIPSMVKRRDLFTRLMYVLHPQLTHEIELVVDVDNGEMSIGLKRQRLLERALGDYIVFIDDDDLVANIYVKEILEAIEQKPDAVGFNGEIISLKNDKSQVFEMTSKHKKWSQGKDGTFYRGIEHLSPVRREIALKVGFPDKHCGEDHDYSIGVNKLIDTEVYIDKVLYRYLTRGCV